MFDDNAKSFFNRAILTIVQRADLESRVISRAIVCELLKAQFFSFEVLHDRVNIALNIHLDKKVFRNHVSYTNDALKAVNNLDPRLEVLIAQIYEITIEHNGELFTRIALVHNVR